MTYLKLSNTQYSNSGYILGREFLCTSESGAYASSTIPICHSRKYHGLLVVPQPQIDQDSHVLLSGLDETIVKEGVSHHLAMHKYPGVFYPQGHNYLKNFQVDPVPRWTYSLGNILIEKELLLPRQEDRVMIRFTIKEAKKGFKIRFAPLLAFRNYHSLNKADLHSSEDTSEINNGIKIRMIGPYDELFLQFSQKATFTHAPKWYYNMEYTEEQARGYDYQEDLYSPGLFEIKVKKGDQFIFTTGLDIAVPRGLKASFNRELKNIPPLKSYENCLSAAARQFVFYHKKQASIKAGFHWFERWGRDTFIALPGLTLVKGNPRLFKKIVDTNLKDLKLGLFANIGFGQQSAYNSVDAPLWFFWALQQYIAFTRNTSEVWENYNTAMKSILKNFKKGTLYNIRMQDSGLLHAGTPGVALTWMDAVVADGPVTPRIGMDVEVNALWYNAICFCLELAKSFDDKTFLKEWQDWPEIIKKSFTDTFWDEEKGYLADCVNADIKDWSIRPNQIFAVSLPYSPVSVDMSAGILKTVEAELLTPRGLRTLSPKDEKYCGKYEGNQDSRDRAYHQGTVWPWLLGHFVEATIKVRGNKALPLAKELYKGFEPTLLEQGLYTVSEVFDGDAPHRPGGAISQAWSVAELLRINDMINKNQKPKK